MKLSFTNRLSVTSMFIIIMSLGLEFSPGPRPCVKKLNPKKINLR